MELKVWVEGIQRIVCGVNEKTTCQDVVYALAHATGKTGRFTLIERWRNSERLLAPNEQPLKVLLKWGEHSNDVQFILQWAPLDSGGTKAPVKHPETHNDYMLAKNNPSSTAPGSAQSNATSSKHKSSLFSSANAGNQPSLEEGSMKRKEVIPSVGVVRDISQRANETLTNSSSSASPNGKVINANCGSNYKSLSGGGLDRAFDLDGSPGRKLKDLNLSGPPPYREPPNPSKAHAHSPVSGSVSNKGLPPYREPPPPNLSQVSQQQGQQQQRVSGSASSNIQSNSSSNVTNTSGSSGNQASKSTVLDSNPSNSASRTSESYSSVNSVGEKADSTSKIKDYSITNGDISTLNQNGSLPKQSSTVSSSSPQYQDLARLINLQREKLTSQHAEMTQYDAEIMFWEGKTKEQQRHLEFITKEISRLELSAQQESLGVSLMHLEEEDELVRQKSDTLRSEIDSLRTEFDKCEKELDICKSKMGLLTNELNGHHASVKQKQEEWMQREANTLAEIERLKKELDLARRETEAVTDLSGTLDAEVSTVEADLAGKKKQMERLINAMKEANLQSLTVQPPDELIDGGTHHRSGSTRRMIGSPRQLENAAPTSKNPHGVWV